jgi:SAM-dependent methyltransferase
MHCRNCGASLHFVLVDLGSSPLSNAYLTQVTMRRPEKWFPLRVLVCQECWLVQAESYSRAAEIFNDEYAYFSSFSDAWLQHAEAYFIAISEELGLTSTSFVVEIASNDGYLLKHFVAAGVPCLGIEPTASTASAARLAGVPTVERFFGESFALEVRDEHRAADLVIGNNVFAHVPDPIDFLIGIERLLTDSGIATLEFPHLVNLVQQNQFDTIYHEHFAYLSLTATRAMAERAGLQVFRVEDLATHGGSIRVYFQRSETGVHAVHESVDALLAREETLGIDSTEFYSHLQESALQA